MPVAADSAVDNSPIAAGARALRARLTATHPEVTRWDIAPLRPTADSPLPDMPQAAEWSTQVTRLGVRSAVWIAAASAGSRGALVWYSVAGYGQTVVATRRIAPAAVLDPRDGEWASADLMAAACKALESPQALDGMRARITIQPGEVICTGAIEERPPVARGEEVTVRYASGPVVLTARAVAQGDGRLGKPVMVRSTTSGDVFSAKVSGKAEVSVND
jgi:flagella basal body P-ring formation protein FlgA